MTDLSRIRSILFVPGDSAKKLSRAAGLPADLILIDWEDAVAEANKPDARSVTQRALPGIRSEDRPVLVRPNSPSSVWFAEDCAAIRQCRPDGVVIPKCESVRDVELVAEGLPGTGIIVPLIESPLGVLRAAELASCSDRVKALLFGAEDYCVESRIRRTEDEPEVTFARSSVVNAARAMRKQVFDSPPMQYEDVASVRRAATRGRRLGFTGQAAIHPAQLPVINEAYSPSASEVAEAKIVLRRFEDHGGGVYSVQGSLEDYPMVREALAVLERAGESA
ncbi:MAG: CoA ester lyase [Bryobacterales bacterium]|nr:CoA ester lyase [Bryobacterales bacterium]